MDHVSKEIRSKIMAAIHSRGNTTTELSLARLLWAARIRGYRKHWPVAGKPDFAWPSRKVAVFVDGCFWHGCRCKHLPCTNVDFWRNKIETNKRRDRRVSQSLRRDGWIVIRIKECAIRKPATLKRIARVVEGRAASVLLGRTISG